MTTTIVTIPAGEITDWDSFHTVFQTALGFPAFYGGNMNAWIDCMTYVDDPPRGMTRITAKPSDTLTLRIADAADFERRRPELYQALVESVAFVNDRRVVMGEKPVLVLVPFG